MAWFWRHPEMAVFERRGKQTYRDRETERQTDRCANITLLHRNVCYIGQATYRWWWQRVPDSNQTCYCQAGRSVVETYTSRSLLISPTQTACWNHCTVHTDMPTINVNKRTITFELNYLWPFTLLFKDIVLTMISLAVLYTFIYHCISCILSTVY